MKLDYIVSRRTNGANPFQIWDALKSMDQGEIRRRIARLDYGEFLQTAYWFAVSSVCKARAKMRCQVCNSGDGLNVHHRTYENHGVEHLFMEDLVCLCGHCHGMFHGKMEPAPRKPAVVEVIQVIREAPPQPAQSAASKGGRKRNRRLRVIDHPPVDSEMPDGNPITLTHELIDRTRANGSFTNATLRALKVPAPLVRGWTLRLVGTQISREEYRAALEGRYIYNSGPLGANGVPFHGG